MCTPAPLLEAGAWVHAHVALAAGARVGSGSIVGPGCSLAEEAVLVYQVALAHCNVGSCVVLRAGACAGQDTFGLPLPEAGMGQAPHGKRVVLGARLELGAGACMDRGWIRSTTIGDSTKVDSQVHIGRGVAVGAECVLCAQAALGAGCTLGDRLRCAPGSLGQPLFRLHPCTCLGEAIAETLGLFATWLHAARLGSSATWRMHRPQGRLTRCTRPQSLL